MRKQDVSKTGFSCPYCNTDCTEKTLMSSTKSIRGQEGDLSWLEKHKCKKCRRIYYIPNGT